MALRKVARQVGVAAETGTVAVACSLPRGSTRDAVALLLAVVAAGDRKESAKIMPTPIPTPKMVMAAFIIVRNENCRRLLRTTTLVL